MSLDEARIYKESHSKGTTAKVGLLSIRRSERLAAAARTVQCEARVNPASTLRI